MKISVALCTYNGGSYILEQLQSIASQTRLPDEIIVSDDRSSDDTQEIVLQFAATAPFKLQFSTNLSRIGVTKNFEHAISLCSGDVIFLCDQDDVWLPQKIAEMMQPFMANDNVGLVFSNAYITDTKLNQLGYTVWDTFRFDKIRQRAIRSDEAVSILIRRNIVTGATAAFRSTLKNVILPIPGKWMHDAWIAFIAAATSRIEFIDTPLILYRQHERNVIGGRRLNTFEMVATASQTTPASFDNEISQISELLRPEILQRLQAKMDIKVIARISREMQHKILHLNARRAVFNCNYLSRIPIVIRELVTLNYHRYSRGWSSAITDLVLRSNRP